MMVLLSVGLPALAVVVLGLGERLLHHFPALEAYIYHALRF